MLPLCSHLTGLSFLFSAPCFPLGIFRTFLMYSGSFSSDCTSSATLLARIDEGAPYFPLLSLTVMLGYVHQHRISFSVFFRDHFEELLAVSYRAVVPWYSGDLSERFQQVNLNLFRETPLSSWLVTIV